MERKKLEKRINVVDMVIGQIEVMWDVNLSNKEQDCGDFYETFEGWCEDGDVFEEKIGSTDATNLMKKISFHVDEITEILAHYLGEPEF